MDESNEKVTEEFAAEHDPANHDIAAGEEFRQPTDWTAEDHGGPQVWDSEGTLVEGHDPRQNADGTLQTGVGGALGATGGAGGDQGADGRRISSIEEIRDGGYGIGSAATLEDGAQPFGHDVKAWEDTRTHLQPGDEGYDGVDPHLWFADGESAERAGFPHAH
ncbi:MULTISPECIES: hypothetical protein [unclassified Janibacter]|uniref:sunset domain-containing protein n=1 Tax=unclassified Janibacter TaxID=2649294 RepID=UPI003D020FD5